jgi:AraC family transcriptional regulator of adaptative response/methylated-DNA-[protein]-cysteine methyltransferase
VTLAALGDALGVSPFHLQRTFTQVMGVSPRAYHDARRAALTREALATEDSVLSASLAVGHGSTSRLHARANDQLGMTPASFRNGARGQTIRYALSDSPLGRLLVATTERGLCAVTLGDDDRTLIASLTSAFPRAELAPAHDDLAEAVRAVLARFDHDGRAAQLPLDVRATAFQRRVWDALRAIPRGETRTYRQIAETIGSPRSVRAVAHACASNGVAIVVPCHRVVRTDGAMGGYRWGVERKRALLHAERTRTQRE